VSEFSAEKSKKDDEFSIGYRFTPTLSISRNEKKEVVLGMVDEYCEDHGVIYRTENRTNGSSQIIIYQPESIKRFIEPIFSGLIQQQDEAEIMLDEILPMVEDGKHTTKRGMFEIAGHLDTLEKVFSEVKRKVHSGILRTRMARRVVLTAQKTTLDQLSGFPVRVRAKCSASLWTYHYDGTRSVDGSRAGTH